MSVIDETKAFGGQKKEKDKFLLDRTKKNKASVWQGNTKASDGQGNTKVSDGQGNTKASDGKEKKNKAIYKIDILFQMLNISCQYFILIITTK